MASKSKCEREIGPAVMETDPAKGGGEGIGRHSQGVCVLDVGLEHLERVPERLAHGADDHLLLLLLGLAVAACSVWLVNTTTRRFRL